MTESIKPTAREGGAAIAPGLNALKDKVLISGHGRIDNEAVARAEAALEQLSVEFDSWMDEEVASLLEAHGNVSKHGLVDPHAEALFIAAHDLKGQAETLGYPLIGKYCASMCKMFEAVEDKSKIPLHAVDSHINAVQAAFRNGIKHEENATANAVYDRLLETVMEFYNHHQAAQAEAGEKTGAGKKAVN